MMHRTRIESGPGTPSGTWPAARRTAVPRGASMAPVPRAEPTLPRRRGRVYAPPHTHARRSWRISQTRGACSD